MTQNPASPHEFLTQESRVAAIACLHRQLCENFEAYNQGAPAPSYDRRLEAAYLHSVFDQLVEEVSVLTTDLDLHDGLLERAGFNGSLQKNRFRPKSIATLMERYSALIDSLRAAFQAATGTVDEALAAACSELARQFEESLWYMVADVHGWRDSDAEMAL